MESILQGSVQNHNRIYLVALTPRKMLLASHCKSAPKVRQSGCLGHAISNCLGTPQSLQQQQKLSVKFAKSVYPQKLMSSLMTCSLSGIIYWFYLVCNRDGHKPPDLTNIYRFRHNSRLICSSSERHQCQKFSSQEYCWERGCLIPSPLVWFQ